MYRELYLQAQAVRNYAYAPYSQNKVGAALLTSEGVMYAGVNVENASYRCTVCAEQVAVSKAISEGNKHFDAIAICGNDGTIWPCGACRQVLHEFAPNIKIVTGENEDNLEVIILSELFQKGFEL